jgi:peptidoglycan/xylan/chitin deacetylase (PgdA/CDA1 family)
MQRVLILNYHKISNDNKKDSLYTVRREDFISQLELIQQFNIPILGFQQLDNYPGKDTLGILLSFDDGNASDFNVVLPILERYALPAIFFPTIELIGKEQYVSWSQVQELSAKGFEIGSHGVSHRPLTNLSMLELEHELNESKSILELQLKKEIKQFAAPYGRFNKKTIKQAKLNGYSILLSTGKYINDLKKNRAVLFRWNMRGDTTIEELKQVLALNGQQTFRMKLSFYVKRLAKKIVLTKVSR